MKQSGAWLTARALENIGVKYTFGIPGVHNTEIYDQLNRSEQITPILVTHEQGASFIGEAFSRVSDSIGCLLIVPAAGMTHAMSGIGEAYLDGVPLLVISGGIRRDSGRHYQLHQLDQQRVLDGITKAAFLVDKHENVVSTIYEAYEIATSGLPGPVFVEIATDVQMFTAEVSEVPKFVPSYRPPKPDRALVRRAVELLRNAKQPGMYLGWGAEVAELLGAPVSTTLQGISVFPHDHALHTGFGFGPSAVPAARKAFEGVDCLLAVGVRFAELATGSYGMPIPETLIHADIDPEVFSKNYPATVAIEADGELFMMALLEALKSERVSPPDRADLEQQIAREKEAFFASWTSKVNEEKVSPGIFFRQLRKKLDRDAYVIVDDGNHTFLTAEQFPVYESKHLISPTDFNCMGYCVPGTIGVKLSHPDKQVCAIVGDGAFMMTALEILTATMNELGAVFFVFHDGELAQISQLQALPLKDKTCSIIGDLQVEGVATATGAAYIRMDSDLDVDRVLDEALAIAGTGRPVIVDVNIDYSRKSAFTQGVIKVNLGRFPLGQKVRYIGRALKRHTIG
ncbi:MAG: thiamine pyrophosphate-binding protein [Deltaproteobacteria bacterium]|nr:thiamine pyrophosphate-binding protein [Deltaproteobacteria bacterium]